MVGFHDSVGRYFSPPVCAREQGNPELRRLEDGHPGNLHHPWLPRWRGRGGHTAEFVESWPKHLAREPVPIPPNIEDHP